MFPMPTCLEKKLLLSGELRTYPCELVSLEDGVGILRYVIDQEYDVAGLRLSPGDVTLAVYWESRPYTLYIWVRSRQRDRAHYFNISDSVTLWPDEFVWRDLVVDILVDPEGMVSVLDENELPPDLPPDLVAYIEEARNDVLVHFRDIIKQAEGLLRARAELDTD